MEVCLGSAANISPPDECTIDLGSSFGAVMCLGREVIFDIVCKVMYVQRLGILYA